MSLFLQVVVGKAHIVALTKEGEVYSCGMNHKGQCGRDFSRQDSSHYGRNNSSAAVAVNDAAAAAAVWKAEGEAAPTADMTDAAAADQSSDHDGDVDIVGAIGGEDDDDDDDPEGFPKICGAGKHKWKHDQCMVCSVCGECSG